MDFVSSNVSVVRSVDAMYSDISDAEDFEHPSQKQQKKM